MSILSWAVGEEIEFSFRDTGVVTDNTAGTYRSTYTRGSLHVQGTTPAGTGKLADGIPLASPVTSCWLSGQWYANNVSSQSPSFGMGNSSNTLGGFFIGPTSATANKLALYTIDTTGTITKVASETGTSLVGGALTRVDIQVTTWNNASTNIKVYLAGNSTAAINWTGSTTGIFTNLDCFRYMSNGTNNHDWVSEIIIADEDTRAFVGVATLVPNGAGTVNTFDTGAYTDNDELVLDDSDMLQSATAAQEFECNLSNLPAGNFKIRGVKITARASKGATGPGTLKLGIDSGGTDNTVDQTLTTSLASYERVMPTNPVTSAAWTSTEVNALQADLVSAT